MEPDSSAAYVIRLTLGISRSGAHHYTRSCRLHAVLARPFG